VRVLPQTTRPIMQTTPLKTPDPRNRKKARLLRHDSTFPERLLWSILRNRQLEGLKFRRQFSIPPYVADFCCVAAMLIVEVDGLTHVGTGRSDDLRSEYLWQQGYQVVRVTDDDVIPNLDAVAEEICKAVNERMKMGVGLGKGVVGNLVAPSPRPSPAPGRGRGGGRG